MIKSWFVLTGGEEKGRGLRCLAQGHLGGAQVVNWHLSNYQSKLHIDQSKLAWDPQPSSPKAKSLWTEQLPEGKVISKRNTGAACWVWSCNCFFFFFCFPRTCTMAALSPIKMLITRKRTTLQDQTGSLSGIMIEWMQKYQKNISKPEPIKPKLCAYIR